MCLDPNLETWALGNKGLTSLFTGWGLLPSFTSRKCKGAIIAPMLRMSAYFSSSVVRAELGSPVRGPSPGREPAVTEGSGICPGIIAGGVAGRPGGVGEKQEEQVNMRRRGSVNHQSPSFPHQGSPESFLLPGRRSSCLQAPSPGDAGKLSQLTHTEAIHPTVDNVYLALAQLQVARSRPTHHTRPDQNPLQRQKDSSWGLCT